MTLTHRYLTLLALRWFATGLIIPVAALLPLERGLTLAELGVAMAAQGVVVLLLEVPSGALTDAWGRRPVLLASVAAAARASRAADGDARAGSSCFSAVSAAGAAGTATVGDALTGVSAGRGAACAGRRADTPPSLRTSPRSSVTISPSSRSTADASALAACLALSVTQGARARRSSRPRAAATAPPAPNRFCGGGGLGSRNAAGRGGGIRCCGAGFQGGRLLGTGQGRDQPPTGLLMASLSVSRPDGRIAASPAARLSCTTRAGELSRPPQPQTASTPQLLGGWGAASATARRWFAEITPEPKAYVHQSTSLTDLRTHLGPRLAATCEAAERGRAGVSGGVAFE